MSNLVKFIYPLLQKFHQNSGNPRCNERPPHQKSAQGETPTYQNHSVEHLACTVSLHFQRDSEDQRDSVSFSSLEFSHVSTVRLARCAQPLLPVQSATRALGRFLASAAPWPACAGVFRGGRATRGGRTEPASPRYAVLRRPLLPSPPRGSCMPAHPRSTVAVARQAQGAPSAADGPAPPRSAETSQHARSNLG